MKFKAGLIGVVTVCAVCVSAYAANPLNGCDLSQPIFGKAVKASDLQGKVIFFEYWGIWCPPCRASIPGLVQLQNQYGKTGKFQVISSHKGDANKAKVFCKNKRVNFPVYQNLVPKTAPFPRSFPRAYLFDYTGKLVAQGHPNSVKLKVAALVKAAPMPQLRAGGQPVNEILEGIQIEHCRVQAKMISLGKPLLPTMSALKKFAEIDDARGKEAGKLIKRIREWIEGRTAEAEKLIPTQPTIALETLNLLTPMLARMEQQERVLELRQPLHENKDLQKLLRYRREIQIHMEQLGDPDHSDSAKKALQAISMRLAPMLDFPDLPKNIAHETQSLIEQIDRAA